LVNPGLGFSLSHFPATAKDALFNKYAVLKWSLVWGCAWECLSDCEPLSLEMVLLLV
jgi:hypothetical protein